MSGIPQAGRRVGSTMAEGFREIIWYDIRDGLPRLSDLPAATRVLGMLGIVLILAAAGGLFFVDAMRGSSSLVAGGATLTGRSQLVPLVLVPIAIVVLTVAWTYLLAGAAESHVGIRLTVATLYLATTLMWLDGTVIASAGVRRIALVLLIAVAVIVVLLPRDVFEGHTLARFAIFALLVSGTWVGAAVLGARTALDTAVATPVVTFGLLLSLARGLALPLFVVAGLGMAVFAYQLSSWAGDSARVARSEVVPRLLLAALASAAAFLASRDALDALRAGAGGPLLGALLFVALPVGVWLAARRWTPDAGIADEGALVEAAEGSVTAVAAIFLAPLGLATALLLVTGGAGAAIHLTGGVAVLSNVGQALDGVVQRLTASIDVYVVLFDVVAAAAGGFFLRRRPTLGVYLLVLATANGWEAAVSRGPLVVLDWQNSGYVAFWITLLVLGRTALALRRGRLDGRLRRNLTVALGVAVLFSQVDFLENPFNPVFAFAGVAFVATAVAVDTLTLGNWANTGTPALPRASRLHLYVGYALFSLALVLWAAATHDFAQFDLYTGDAAVGGLRIFGNPLLLALVAALLFGAERAGEPPAVREPEEAG